MCDKLLVIYAAGFSAHLLTLCTDQHVVKTTVTQTFSAGFADKTVISRPGEVFPHSYLLNTCTPTDILFTEQILSRRF